MYIPKDHWMICDRCGAKYRRSEMREEWTGLWVCTRGCWETRHPQDFVEAKKEDTAVDVARPDVIQSSGSTTLNGSLSAGDTSVTLTSAIGLESKDVIGVTMDNGAMFWSFIEDDPVANVVVLNTPIPNPATTGNNVLLPSINNEEWA